MQRVRVLGLVALAALCGGGIGFATGVQAHQLARCQQLSDQYAAALRMAPRASGEMLLDREQIIRGTRDAYSAACR